MSDAKLKRNFIETARALDCDESEHALDKALEKLNLTSKEKKKKKDKEKPAK